MYIFQIEKNTILFILNLKSVYINTQLLGL